MGRSEGIFRSKADGTDVHYFVFSEYELHEDELQPGSVQGWHHHERVDELLYVLSGTLEVRWVGERGVEVGTAREGDIVQVGTVSHSLANVSPSPARFLVFRTVPDGTDKRELIRDDKVIDDPPS